MLEGYLLRERVKVHLRAGALCSLFNTGGGYRLPHIQQRFTVLMGHALFSSVRASPIMALCSGTWQPILPSLPFLGYVRGTCKNRSQGVIGLKNNRLQ